MAGGFETVLQTFPILELYSNIGNGLASCFVVAGSENIRQERTTYVKTESKSSVIIVGQG